MRVAFSLLALPLLALAAPLAASKPEQETQEQPAKPEEAKKICKSVSEGVGSRRMKRVCLTAEEWVKQNQGQ